MTELLTAAQMRAIEQAAIASGEVTGLELMERAGRGVVEAIFEEWPELAPSWGPAPKPPEYLLQDDEVGVHRAVILCGPGNNGGDGFVVARLLKEAGWDVEVFLYGDAGKLPPDARANYERWGEMGEVRPLTNEAMDGYADDNLETSIAIDAIFGSGLSRPFFDLGRVQVELNYWQSSAECPSVVAVDMPSGWSADTGQFIGFEDGAENPFDGSPLANLTVTFHKHFLGHVLSTGPEACGHLKVASIGLEQTDIGVTQIPYATSDFWRHDQRLAKSQNFHKYAHGNTFILSGGVGKGGAARLAARGALRVGAGVVTVGCPPAALIENAEKLDAIMLQDVKDAGALDAILEDDRINALCLGPGMGTGDREAALVAAALGGIEPRPSVLDADALTLLARDDALFAQLHEKCVLTPHAGEFARLFPDIAEKLGALATKGPAYSKVDATREAAKRAGCVVLFKGPDTVIADPSGRCSINASVYERSAPWLATAGSGDVLAGFIAGSMARGFGPMQAAETGAWLHTECALSFGPGLIAEDLPEELPRVFRALGI